MAVYSQLSVDQGQQAWDRQVQQNPQQQIETYWVSGNSYDSRNFMASNRSIMAPTYSYTSPSYVGLSHDAVNHHQSQLQHEPYHQSYSSQHPPIQVNFIQTRPMSRPLQHTDNRPYAQRNYRHGIVESSLTSNMKSEPQWTTQSYRPSSSPRVTKTISPTLPTHGDIKPFDTHVDNLMRVIQGKNIKPEPASSPQSPLQVSASNSVVRSTSQHHAVPHNASMDVRTKLTSQGEEQDEKKPSGKRRYRCPLANCKKQFCQKTHLDIHARAHTGDKPYPCTAPGCGKRFSQAGNLKTHERRHTGARPYKCDICNKTFAQKGNVNAHRTVHNGNKPFECRLDNCGKTFTQLGNLKSHQNKFHESTIRSISAKFSTLQPGDPISADDTSLWEYLCKLYKNSNKGIKGRGKDNKVGQLVMPAYRGAYEYAGWGAESSGSSGPSSVGTAYDEVEEDFGRSYGRRY